MRKTRYAAFGLAVLSLSAGLLTGCSMGGDAEPSPTPTAEPVADATLAPVLDELVRAGAGSSDDGGKCLVEAVREAGLSPEAEMQLVETAGDDFGLAVAEVRENVGAEAAGVLLSPALRTGIDDCLTDFLGDEEVTAVVADQPEPIGAPDQPAPDTKPVYTEDLDIDTLRSDDLRPGLVSMLSSFATEEEAQLIERTGSCMADAVSTMGFSDEALMFFAGGAKLGSGSVAEHLSKDDAAIWNSPTFKAILSGCLDAPAQDEDEIEE